MTPNGVDFSFLSFPQSAADAHGSVTSLLDKQLIQMLVVPPDSILAPG